MASNVGNAVVTVTLDDSIRQRIISVLERAKHEHHSERDGLMSCPANSYEQVEGQWKYVDRPELCDCGASEINTAIDAMIAELRKPPKQRDLVNQDRFGNEML